MNHRIALVTLSLSNDDKRMYHFMAKELSSEGWRVEIINPYFEGKDSNRIYFRRIKLPKGMLMSKIYSHRNMMQGLLESRADLAIFYDADLLKMLPKAKRVMPIQVIFDANEQSIKNKTLLKGRLSFADAIIADSEHTAAALAEVTDRSCTVICGVCDSDMLFSLCDELERDGRYHI